MKNKIELYKIKYNDYIIICKSGNFYTTLNDDALIINNLFDYKIKHSMNYIKTGFPIISLNKVIDKLKELKINYIIIDNNIIDKFSCEKNNYNKYNDDVKDLKNNIKRINYIYTILSNNIYNIEIDDLLRDIERKICKIN